MVALLYHGVYSLLIGLLRYRFSRVSIEVIPRDERSTICRDHDVVCPKFFWTHFLLTSPMMDQDSQSRLRSDVTSNLRVILLSVWSRLAAVEFSHTCPLQLLITPKGATIKVVLLDESRGFVPATISAIISSVFPSPMSS